MTMIKLTTASAFKPSVIEQENLIITLKKWKCYQTVDIVLGSILKMDNENAVSHCVYSQSCPSNNYGATAVIQGLWFCTN